VRTLGHVQLLHDDKARKLKYGSYNLLDECDVIPFQQDAPRQGVCQYSLVHATLITAFGNYFGALANWAKLQAVSLHRRLARPHTHYPTFQAPSANIHDSTHNLQKVSSFFPSDEVTQVARCLLGSIVMGRPGLELCRAYLDSELYSTDRRKIEADDDMEGTFYRTYF
jgi:hypothetical protein